MTDDPAYRVALLLLVAGIGASATRPLLPARLSEEAGTMREASRRLAALLGLLALAVPSWAAAQGAPGRPDADAPVPAEGAPPEGADRRAARVDTLALESHARFLAHDLLEGRAPASRGERIAALYIEAELSRLGVRPLGSDDYRLPVPLTAVHVDRERAAMRVTGDGRRQVLRPPSFYHPGGSGAAFRGFAGEALFAGAASGALAALEEHRDLSGRVVVLTPPWDGLAEVEEELLRRGAAGAVELVPGPFYDRLRVVRGPTRYFLPDGVDDPANQGRLPRVAGGPDVVRALGLTEEAEAREAVGRARPLGLAVEVELPHTTEARTGHNVAGYVPGADPGSRDEWVVVVAHYDHVGYGEPTAGDSIWNGFIDNAAGSAMVLELAGAIAADPPARSVAFVWVTAEEQGLLGSNWFVHDPPLPLGDVRAVLNLDGGAPPAPPARWGLVGGDASPAGRTARRVVEDRGWPVTAVDVGPQSDHWPFHLAGVPAMLLFPTQELEGLTEEQAEALRERWHRPHTADDEWSPGFPFAGLERYAALALEITRALAGPDGRGEDGGPPGPPERP